MNRVIGNLWFAFAALTLVAQALGQTSAPGAGNESKFHAYLRGEKERVAEHCGGNKTAPANPQKKPNPLVGIAGCAQTFFTDHPFHIAVGSIAPQNGFSAGLAFLYETNFPGVWRVRWNADAVVSTNQSWRAGLYLKAYPATGTTVPVLSGYVQSISLNKLLFFGIGNQTASTARSFYGMQETIAGVSALAPVLKDTPGFSWLHAALFGEINGRFVDIRGRHGDTSPSIEQLYNEANAPGLTNQPAVIQFGEGIRLHPGFFSDWVKLNYQVTFQQFIAPSDSTFSFRRLTLDFAHEIALTSHTKIPTTNEAVGPDGRPGSDPAEELPPIKLPTNREGSIEFRAFISESIAPAGHVVPFYFQPTLGGSDINGNQMLSSYQDYRFRAPNVMLLRGAFEHAIPHTPVGVAARLDYGKVAMTRGDISFDHMRHSYATGLTIRAGNFPQFWLMFAWGGGEGSHTIAHINPGLLGGSARPSLF